MKTIYCVCVLALATGCGSKTVTQSGGGSGGGGGGVTTGGVTGDPNIYIGAISPINGAYAAAGVDQNSGYNAAAAWVNSLGGLLGKTVVLQAADSGSTSPDGGTTEAKALVNTHHVSAILGFPLANNIGPAMEAVQVPYLTFFAAGDMGTPRNYMYRPFPSLAPTPRVEALDMNNTLHAQTVAYAAPTSTTLSTPGFFPFLHALNQYATWVPVAYPNQSDPASFDASSYVNAALAQTPPPTVFYVGTSSEVEAVQVISALNNAGFANDHIYINPYLGNIPFEYDDVTDLTGVRVVLADSSLIPANAQSDAFDRYAQFSGGGAPDGDSASAFDISGWLYLAIAQAGTTSGPALQQALLDVVGNPAATQVTTAQLDVGLQLIAQGKPVWWVSALIDPFSLAAPGDDPVDPFDVFLGQELVPDAGNLYLPSQFNIPAFNGL